MSGVPNQESVTVCQTRDDPPMHPKRREPADVRRSIFVAKACYDPGDNFYCRYLVDILFQILETDPAPSRKRREQQQSIRTADDAGLNARKRR